MKSQPSTWEWSMVGCVVTCLAACAPGPFEDEADVRKWANEGSALAVYLNIYDEVALAAGQHEYADADCPVVADDGTTITVTGDGCTTGDGELWNGTSTIVRKGGDDVDLEYEDFGKSEEEGTGKTGSASVRQSGDGSFDFEMDLEKKFGIVTTIHYEGNVDGYYDQPTLWNGSGRIARDGFLPPTGTVYVSTEDQLWDEALCDDAAASGQTSIEQDGHRAVIFYDGETDCDEDQAAKWTLNGEGQGAITGISCAVAPSSGRAPALLTLSVLLLWSRRRRRRGEPS